MPPAAEQPTAERSAPERSAAEHPMTESSARDMTPGARPGGTPLRRQLLTAIAGVTAVAVVLFSIPLAVVVQRLYRNEAVTALERDATRVAAAGPDDEAKDATRGP